MSEFTSWRKSSRSGGGDDSQCVECRRGWRKSSYSGGGDDSNCLEARPWRKSNRSGGGPNSNCVEARSSVDTFQVRDSKLGHDSPVFDLESGDFTALLSAAK